MKLQAKICVITGGAMGNGLGIVKVFLKYGAKVIIIDYAKETLDVVNKLKDANNEVTGYICDIRSKEQVQNIIDEIGQKYGHIDVLVNNAGVCYLEKFSDMDDDLRDTHFDINIKGTWNVTKNALPYMKNINASIINLSSVTGPCVADAAKSLMLQLKQLF